MKLLLWACVMCVAFAKRRRYPFIHKKSPSPSEEDYYGHRYPLNPSLNIPYGLWNDNLPPFLLPPVDTHQGNTITKFTGNPDLDRGLSPYPWILTSSKVHYLYQNPNYPSDAPPSGPAATAPLPPPPPPPPRPYPFVIPPKISVSPIAPEPASPQGAPAVGEGLVPEFAVDKSISGLPTAVKLGQPLPPQPAEPKASAGEPAPAQFGPSEPVPVQFGGLESIPAPSGVIESPAGHPIAPEPAPPQVVAAAQAISAESPAGQSAENKPASGEPSIAQSIPPEPAGGQSAEIKPSAPEPAALQPPPPEPVASQSLPGKLITSEPTEVKPESAEPAEAKPGSQEPQPFLFYQVQK
ncbi:proline-rich protein 27 isoform X1 [Mesocricetus auratus]|uniref:Proline-rich protein 27 isoform X1 n=1 Tax=Mesocricetus auratus TaxID=10036 RepID=A0ABM2XLS3_MESAU|nr:proline-rich protein 27 isoform X1 [Mesocricetus auratus]